jgi:site-specific DNA-methyltransferase (adenine-specific)
MSDDPRYSLLLGNCLERMKEIPDGSVDMVMCDLPYGTTQNKWDSVIPLEPLWAAYRRVCKPSAAIVLTAADPFSSVLVSSNMEAWRQTLVWEKNCASNFLNAKKQHLQIHENVILFAQEKATYNPQMSAGKPYKVKRSGKDDSGDCYGAIKQRTDTENSGERYPQSVLRFPRETGLHPTQKPVALMEYLIRTYTNEGEVVLDNTMGSGTTGVACVKSNRRFIGIERDPEYFKIATERIQSTQPEMLVIDDL